MTARKRRAARGGGSVYYDANAKRWVASITTTDPDGRRRRVKQTARTKADAAELLARMVAERKQTGQVSPKDYTVAHALDDLLRHPPPTWKTATTRRINDHLAGRLRAGLGSVLLSRLNAGQVAEHLRKEVTAGLAQRTIRSEKALLRKAIDRAEAHDLVTRNVAAKADMPAGARTRKSGSMTLEQAARLLTSAPSPRWKAWLSVAIMCGLRPGEIGALSWDDVELAAGQLRVRHSLHETPGGLAPDALKTEQSRRTLGMPQAVTDALIAWGAEQAEQRRLAAGAWQDSGGLIFTDGFGRPFSRQRIHRGFRAVCAAAGVARPDGQPFQPRECRHTAVSLLSDRGVPIEQIADAVGHVNSRVTSEVYRHLLADKIQVTATVMDAIFEERSTS